MTYKIDVHLNLAGTGTSNSGCFASNSFRNRYTIRFLRIMHGISPSDFDTNFDEKWAQKLADLVKESAVDFGVVLGFDQVHDPENGKPLPEKTQMFVPPSWIFQVCKRYPGLLPGPGINPYRKDAIQELNSCVEQGAVLIKWLPPAQEIDPADKKLAPFYQEMVRLKIPLLAHTASERTFKSTRPWLADVTRLQLPLDLGVKIIAAHTATPVLGSFERNMIPEIRHMLEKYDNLWVDNSGICNPGRFHNLETLAQDALIQSRTLYGSDWPIPSNSFYYLNKIGFRKCRELEKIENLITRDIRIKEVFGFRPDTLTRANQVLINLDRWKSSKS